MRSILVPVEESPSLDAQLESAALVAEICSAHIDSTTTKWPIAIESALDSIPTAEPKELVSQPPSREEILTSESDEPDEMDSLRTALAETDSTLRTNADTTAVLIAIADDRRFAAELSYLVLQEALREAAGPVSSQLAPSPTLLEAIEELQGRK